MKYNDIIFCCRHNLIPVHTARSYPIRISRGPKHLSQNHIGIVTYEGESIHYWDKNYNAFAHFICEISGVKKKYTYGMWFCLLLLIRIFYSEIRVTLMTSPKTDTNSLLTLNYRNHFYNEYTERFVTRPTNVEGWY